MALAPLFAALLLTGAQPPAADGPAPTAADADAVMGMFESVCLSNGKAPAGFETVAWSDFPEALRLMNTYDHGGTFLRRASPATYIARTEGPGHMTPGLETRCGVAAQGLETAGIVERLRKSAQVEKTSEMAVAEVAMTLIVGKGGAFTVTKAAENWVIVRRMDMMIPAGSIPRRYRKRK